MLPQRFLDNMQELLKDEYPSYLESFEQSRYYGLRVNTNKISVEDFLKRTSFELEPIPWTTNGFYISADTNASKHPDYYAGLYYLQEPSAMLPAAVLPIEEGDWVLDACAAPGGKSTELANRLKQSGLLVSNDISASRALALLRNLERAGARNIYVISEDLNKLAKKYPLTFDKILVDAPCSGEGMFRKDPSLIKSWLEKDDTYYAPIQKSILQSAVDMIRPGGMIVYSTCTFSRKENEEVIEHILKNNLDMSVEAIPYCPGFVQDLGTRLFPHKIKGEGHFVCLLKKAGNASKHKFDKPNFTDRYVNDFMKHIQCKLKPMHSIQDHVFYAPVLLDTKGVRVLRSGLLLGDLKKNRFEPSQALAMTLKGDDFDLVIDLDETLALKYLKGETLDVSMLNTKDSGWALVCFGGYSLGFGKLNKGSLKNKLDKGWRML